jgi:WD40 repeat protein/energy-coupling factor transporter ATP-binding protein EcfA2
MREPVPNRVAQDFFKYFLLAFAQQRLPLYLAVQQARRKLQGVEDEFPGASWLPVVCLNPAVEPPTWLTLGGIPPCPYRGLFAFKEQDAHLFFGREQFTSDLVAAVKTKPLVAVVGPSGSGKSSVVFAGLIPQLRQETQVQCQIVSFRPGNNPIEALAAAIAPLCQHLQQKDENGRRLVELELETELRHNNKALSQLIEKIVTPVSSLPLIPGGELLASHLLIPPSPPQRLVLIADQFEELYTQTPESERQLFLDALMMACSCAPAFTLVLTLRADFYGHALSYRPFSDALQGAIQNLGPMCGEELQSAIEQPAALMQVRLENGLTDKLIKAAWGEPGRLPLLEFALTTLWSKHQSGWLTNQAYKEIGGVEEALANHAEAVYAQLSEADRQRTQRVFIQLVQPGTGTDASRRLATRDEVKPENWDLVTQLASARLVVTNHNSSTHEETVEIVHEALIRSWGRLEHWMCVDGAFRCWQEQLRAAMRQWESSDFDEGAFLRGKPLCDAQYWQQKRLIELSSGERNFIERSLALRDREIDKQKCRRRLTFSVLSGGLVLALSLAGVACWQQQKARVSEIKEIESSTEIFLNSNQEFDALIASIRAGSRIKHTFGVDADTRIQTVDTLLQAVNFVRERNRLEGHNQQIKSVTFSPNGKTIATASEDSTVKLWSIDGEELRTLKGHNAGVNSAAFSPDGKTLATASWDNTVKLWNFDGKELRTFRGHKNGVYGVAFSPDGKTLATASWDNTVKLWNLDGKELRTLRGHHDKVNCVTFSPDGQTLATASGDNTVKLWSVDGKELRTLKGHKDVVWSVSFSPNGNTIVTASGDRTVKLWSLEGKELQTFKGHENGVNSAKFSPDGQTIASASGDKTVKLWSLDGKELQIFQRHNSGISSLTFSPDGKTLATGSYDKTVKLWSLYSQYTKTLRGHKALVFSLAFNPSGKQIATASWDNSAKLWSLDGKELKTLQGHNKGINRTSFSPDGKMIATASKDNTVKIWNLEGQELRTLKGHKDMVWSVSFSPDGNLIATASEDHTVKLWSLEGKELQTFGGHTTVVNSAIFSPDGKTLATASWDKTVKLWSLDGKELRTLRGHNSGINSVTFSRDGKMIATASADSTAKIWSLDGKELQTLKGHKDGVNSVTFSPDGKMIATASGDNTVKIWSLDGKELQTLKGHKDIVWSVGFSPDGKTLATGSSDNTVILWNLYLEDLDKLLVRACDWTRDYLNNNSKGNKEARRFCAEIAGQ